MQRTPLIRKLRNTRQPVRIAAAVVVVLAVTVLASLAMPAIERQMDRWGLLPRPESFTELSLTQAHDLPEIYKPGEEHQVAFTLHSQENATTAYGYDVTVSNTKGKTVAKLDRGILTLKANETKEVWIRAALADGGAQIYVSIILSNGQSVGYWLERM